MTDAIIHIGFGKTGSSSLQAVLSNQSLADTGYEYCVVDQGGAVLSGPEITKLAGRSPLAYASSAQRLDAIDHAKVRTGLRAIRDRGKTPVISQESWSALGHVFKEERLLEQWGIHEACVIGYVRPQLEYLNSGWWQWWAWNGLFSGPADVVEKWGVKRMFWSARFRPWRAAAGVGKVIVRLHTRDTVDDFFSVLGLNRICKSERKNVGMSRELIQLYRAIPLRTEHGAAIDSVLGPLLGVRPTPWVIPHDLAKKVIEMCRSDNLELMETLSEDQRGCMAEEKRWWSAECYGEASDVDPLTLTEAISMLSKIAPEYVALSRRVHLLRGETP